MADWIASSGLGLSALRTVFGSRSPILPFSVRVVFLVMQRVVLVLQRRFGAVFSLWFGVRGRLSLRSFLLNAFYCFLLWYWICSEDLVPSFLFVGGVGGWCGLVALWGVVVVGLAAFSSSVSSLVVSYAFSWHS